MTRNTGTQPPSRGIRAAERDEIAHLLATLPLAEVRRRTGRSFITLARMAGAIK